MRQWVACQDDREIKIKGWERERETDRGDQKMDNEILGERNDWRKERNRKERGG